MAILTKEQLMESIKNRVGEDTSDEALAFIENVNDTIENNSSSEDKDDDFEEEEKKKPMTYEALFKEE